MSYNDDHAIIESDWDDESCPIDFEEWFEEFDEPIKAFALAVHCGLTPTEAAEVNNLSDEGCKWICNGDDYMVLTDDEAAEMEDEYLDSYIDDLLEIPDNIRFYFDDERWKEDAKQDGRGSVINNWDGSEWELKIGDEWIYIYPQG
jgi:hypothetical protein